MQLTMAYPTKTNTIRKMDITRHDLPSPRELITSIANKVIYYAEVRNPFTELYRIVRKYVAKRCFGKKVKLESKRVRSQLASTEIQEAIAKYLAIKIAEFIIDEQILEIEESKFCFSQTKPFNWGHNLPPLIANRTIFNYVATYNNFERAFAEFLDRASDVLRFVALGTIEQGVSGTSFRIEYMQPNGTIGFYYPDWIVVQYFDNNEVYWIIETKEHICEYTDLREFAIDKWCEQADLIGSETWHFICVDQNDFDFNWSSLRNMVVTIVG